MTFSDFGLNIECNVFQNVTKIIGNGAEWAVKHMPENSVVFVVDEFGSTICFVRTTGKAQLTDTYINAEGDADYKLIGAWINEYLEEHDFQKVGIIVETSSDIHQVVTNNSNTRKENETMKKEITMQEFMEEVEGKTVNVTYGEYEGSFYFTMEAVILDLIDYNGLCRVCCKTDNSLFQFYVDTIEKDGDAYAISVDGLNEEIIVEISDESYEYQTFVN